MNFHSFQENLLIWKRSNSVYVRSFAARIVSFVYNQSRYAQKVK